MIFLVRLHVCLLAHNIDTDKMKNKTYHSVGIIWKFNNKKKKIVEKLFFKSIGLWEKGVLSCRLGIYINTAID
jgi:hypothetical protein